MIKPISHERVVWLRERQAVLTECIRLAQTDMHSMASGGAMRDDLYNALRNFNAENIAISIELVALKNQWDPRP